MQTQWSDVISAVKFSLTRKKFRTKISLGLKKNMKVGFGGERKVEKPGG